MSRTLIIPLGLFALLLGTVSAGPAEEPKSQRESADAQISKLHQMVGDKVDEIVRLRIENDKLQRDVERLKAELNAARVAANAPLVRPLLPPTNVPNVPDGWQLRQFNGVPYYIVPLDSPVAKPATP